MRCGFRQARECGCPAEACAVERPVTAAPTVAFSWLGHLAVCLTGGVIAGLIMFAVAARMEPTLKFTDLVNQEQYHADRN